MSTKIQLKNVSAQNAINCLVDVLIDKFEKFSASTDAQSDVANLIDFENDLVQNCCQLFVNQKLEFGVEI